PLIVGSEFRLEDGLRLVLLARDLEGYGNLCELITLARRRAPKGEYRLNREDLVIPRLDRGMTGSGAGLPGCLALWLPGETPDAGEARWLARHFAGRAWIAVELLRGPDDGHRLTRLREIGEATGLPPAAAGGVPMHVRPRSA